MCMIEIFILLFIFLLLVSSARFALFIAAFVAACLNPVTAGVCIGILLLDAVVGVGGSFLGQAIADMLFADPVDDSFKSGNDVKHL